LDKAQVAEGGGNGTTTAGAAGATTRRRTRRRGRSAAPSRAKTEDGERLLRSRTSLVGVLILQHFSVPYVIISPVSDIQSRIVR
jgi:hypothetical protein